MCYDSKWREKCLRKHYCKIVVDSILHAIEKYHSADAVSKNIRVLRFLKSLKMGKKASLMEVQQSRIIVLPQEGH